MRVTPDNPRPALATPTESTRAWKSAACALLVGAMAHASDFAAAVVDHSPAPGQFVNIPAYNNPEKALGPPAAGGTLTGDNSKVVTLGGFGGSIVLRFDHRVLDDPCNPYGLDFIIFGNAFWVGGNANRRWAEAAVVEISPDANANGLADDPWYVIPGSHGALTIESQPWDNDAGTSTPPANLAWYPAGAPSSFTTAAFALPSLFDVLVLQNPNGLGATLEGVFGYADCSPTLLLGDLNADNVPDAPATRPEDFYTSPDNPFAVGVTPGSGGGDALDIAWAIDPATGTPAAIGGFDFIRIANAVNYVAGATGEISTEISAAADVRPRESFFDLTGDARADAEDLYRWHALRPSSAPACDLSGNALIDDADRALMQRCVRRSEQESAP